MSDNNSQNNQNNEKFLRDELAALADSAANGCGDSQFIQERMDQISSELSQMSSTDNVGKSAETKPS